VEGKRFRIFLICAALLAFAGGASLTSFSAPAPQASGYHQIGKVVLGGEGGWDYVVADPDTHRVFISRGTHVMVTDASGKILGDIPNTAGVHGIAFAPEFNRGYTSNGRGGSVTAFDLKTLATISEIKIQGQNPDAIIYDPASKRIFTMNGGSKDATAIDAKTGEIAGTVALGGRPETPSPDGAGHVFANIEDKNSIVEFDSKTLAVLNTWPIAGCEGPSGQAIDTARKHLIIGCDKVMVFMDYTNGKVVGSVPIADGVDANGFDASLGYAFASTGSGDGAITVAKADANGKYSVVENVKTLPRARTMAVDTSNHNLYTVTAEFGPPAPPSAGAPAGRGGRAPMIPGTFTLLIYGR
jgi:DNA-binding beta-propeller fold protein YncE